MNFCLFVSVAVAALLQTTTAACVRTRLVSPVCSSPIISSPICSTPIISAPICSTPIISAPLCPPILSAPVVPTTTIVQSNSCTNALVDTMNLLTVSRLLDSKLSYCSPLALPVANPVYTSYGCVAF